MQRQLGLNPQYHQSAATFGHNAFLGYKEADEPELRELWCPCLSLGDATLCNTCVAVASAAVGKLDFVVSASPWGDTGPSLMQLPGRSLLENFLSQVVVPLLFLLHMAATLWAQVL